MVSNNYKGKSVGIYDYYVKRHKKVYTVDWNINNGGKRSSVVMADSENEAVDILSDFIVNNTGCYISEAVDVIDVTQDILKFRYVFGNRINQEEAERQGFDLRLFEIMNNRDTIWVGFDMLHKDFLGMRNNNNAQHYYMRRHQKKTL